MAQDPRLDKVHQELLKNEDLSNRLGKAIATAIARVLGMTQVTSIEDLKKDSAIIGTIVERHIIAEFELQRGHTMDCSIADVEVDIKFSIKEFGSDKTKQNPWMIPKEAVGHLCLLTRSDGRRFQVGLVAITEEILTAKGNQDGKRTIKAACTDDHIRWLTPRAPLPQVDMTCCLFCGK